MIARILRIYNFFRFKSTLLINSSYFFEVMTLFSHVLAFAYRLTHAEAIRLFSLLFLFASGDE